MPLMQKIFHITMFVGQILLSVGSIVLAFMERGVLPKILYVVAGLILLPILPLRKKIEGRYHMKDFVIPTIGFLILVVAVMITPIH